MPTDTGASHGSTPPPPSGRPAPRRLVRFPHDGPLGGVCAGVADYLNIDPSIVRIAAVVLAITGPGLPAYVLAWVFVPAADGSVVAPWPRHSGDRGDRTSQILGIGAIAIALSVLWGDWWRPAHGWFVPIGLITFGAWLLLRNRDEDDVVPPAPTVPGPPSPWQPTPPTAPFSVTPAPFPPAGVTEPPSTPTPPDGTSPTDSTETVDSTDTLTDDSDPTTPAEAPDGADPATTAILPGTMSWGPTPPGGSDGPGWAAAGDPGPPLHPTHFHRPRRRRVIGPIVFGALLLWGGLAWLTGVSAQSGLAVGLCIVGAGFVIGAFVGGSKVLILPALLITGALIIVSTVDIPIGSGIGDRTWRVASARELEPTYALGIGDATLDLRDLPLAADTRIDVDVKVGIGHLTVYVPEDATLAVTTEVGAGDSDVLGHEESGSSVKTSRTSRGTADGGRVALDLHLGLGRVEVHRASATLSDTPEVPTTTPTTPPTPTVAPTPTTPPTPTVAVS